MSRKCPECHEAGNRVHLPGCSYGPQEGREEFLRAHAPEIVAQRDEKIRAQAKQITSLNTRVRYLGSENNRLHNDLVEAIQVMVDNDLSLPDSLLPLRKHTTEYLAIALLKDLVAAWDRTSSIVPIIEEARKLLADCRG